MRGDELFELTDTVLCAPDAVHSAVELTLLPEHRRGHGAMHDGLNQGRIATDRLRRVPAGGHADRTWEKRMRELVRPDVLILDDFATRQLTAAQADDLYELVSERQGRSLIVTSNRAPSDWYPFFPNPVVAESLLDRLINTSRQVIMNGLGYRPNKRPKNPTDKPPSS